MPAPPRSNHLQTTATSPDWCVLICASISPRLEPHRALCSPRHLEQATMLPMYLYWIHFSTLRSVECRFSPSTLRISSKPVAHALCSRCIRRLPLCSDPVRSASPSPPSFRAPLRGRSCLPPQRPQRPPPPRDRRGGRGERVAKDVASLTHRERAAPRAAPSPLAAAQHSSPAQARCPVQQPRPPPRTAAQPHSPPRGPMQQPRLPHSAAAAPPPRAAG